MYDSKKPESRKEDIVVQEIKGEILIYDLKRNNAYCLNQTSAMIWQECDGEKTPLEISRRLSQRNKINISEDIVWLALNQLKKDDLLRDSKDFSTPFDNLTRRDIIRRIGFASIVVLPLISAVVAPTSLHAASACGPLGNCSSGSLGTCICTPPVQPGNNNNPAGCRCLTNGDCQGDCSCGNPCTGGTCPSGETCQSGVCRNGGGGGSATLCNGSCPSGSTCITDSSQSNFGSCSGVCLPSPFNTCVGGNNNPVCIPFNGGNLSAPCCPCSIDGDCIGSCSNNNAGPPGFCI